MLIIYSTFWRYYGFSPAAIASAAHTQNIFSEYNAECRL